MSGISKNRMRLNEKKNRSFQKSASVLLRKSHINLWLCVALLILFTAALDAQVIYNNGAVISINSAVVVTGTITNNSGTITNSGTLNAATVTNSATLTNSGTLTATSALTNTSTLQGDGIYYFGGTFTPGSFSAGASTVIFNGSVAQTIPSSTYFYLQTATGGTKTAGGILTINGDLTIGSGSTFDAFTYTHSILGNWINNGTFTKTYSTITFTGAVDAAISGTSTTTFKNMTLNKSASTNVLTLNNNISVDTINITNGELHTGTTYSVTITTANGRTGSGYIYGTITRTHTFSAGTSYPFESPYNTINFSTVGTVSSVTVNVVLTAPSDFPFNGSTARQYTNTVTGSGYTATLRLHYLDAGLDGNDPMSMNLWQYSTSLSKWTSKGSSARDTTNHWVELNTLSDITSRWCLSDDQNVVRWNGKVSTDWGTGGNWTALSGSPSGPPATTDIVSLGDTTFTNQPTITTSVTVMALNFGSSQTATLTLGSGGSLTTNGNVGGTWTAIANHTIAVGAQTLNVGGDLILSDGTSNHTINLTIGTGYCGSDRKCDRNRRRQYNIQRCRQPEYRNKF